MANTTSQLVKYFGTEDRPVKLNEFRAFWESLTAGEKNYYKLVDLETGLIDVAKHAAEGIEVTV